MKKAKQPSKAKAPAKNSKAIKQPPKVDTPLAKLKAELFGKKEKIKMPKFELKEPSKIIVLPEGRESIKYALIEPFAFAEIKKAGGKDLVYSIAEPQLSKDEQKAYDQIVGGLMEILDVELSSIKDHQEALKYLMEKAEDVAEELGIKLKDESYRKILYYIYRNLIGFNEIEAILKDPYVEDISCDGTGIPIYVVHRKYGSVKSNIVFKDENALKDFVVKLAERAGRFISYAEPLLDGTLPDGSRVQASFSKDVTSKGPTFTVRKFSEEPFSPVELIKNGTCSEDVFAYLWLAVESGASVLIAGGTATGKTSMLNALSMFIPSASKIVSIEDSVTGDSKIIIKENNKIRNITIKDFVDNKIKAEVMSINERGKIVWTKPSAYLKHEVNKDIYEIITSTGRRIKVTEDHSLFTLGENKILMEIKPTKLKPKKSFIAVPRILPIECQKTKEINLMGHLGIFKEDFLQGESLKSLFRKYSADDLKVAKKRYIWWKKHNIIKIEEFMKLYHEFSYEELKCLRIKSKNRSSIPVIFDISKEFLEFCGLWLGDGCYDNHNRNAVIISNMDKECRQIVDYIASYLNSNYSIMNDKGVSLRIHSTVFYKFMKMVLRFEGYSDTKKIPNLIFNLSNEQIKPFIRGYFSADGCPKKYEITCASQSYELLEDLQSLLLRLGIVSRIQHAPRKDKCMQMSISSSENIEKFKEISFLQNRKDKKLRMYNSKAHHTVSDIIPLTKNLMNELAAISKVKMQYPYLKEWQHIGRNYMQRIAPEASKFNDMSHTDILWDKVISVKRISSENVEVFDLSVPKYEKFLCNNIFVHNTRELNLPHENWIPSVTRPAFSKGYGEITLFDLLKSAFRQSPDYVIVGEVRGQEAYVMFQGMSAGMPSIGTFHAGKVEDVLNRLQSPPINLSPALIESLDLIVVMVHAREKGENARRMKEIVEIESIDTKTGTARTNRVYNWEPAEDTFGYAGTSWLVQKISQLKGRAIEDLEVDLKNRKRILEWMKKSDVVRFRDVSKIVSDYQRDPEEVLKRLKIK